MAPTLDPRSLALFRQIESKRRYARPELELLRRERLMAGLQGFFRGTAPYFYARLAARRPTATLLGKDRRWIVGDVHLENMGVFATADGSFVYDLNDFDEAVEGSTALDLLRALANITVIEIDRDMSERDGEAAIEAFLGGYHGKRAGDLPKPIRHLVRRAETRTPNQLLDERCPVHHGERRFTIGQRYLALTKDERAVVERLFASYAERPPIEGLKKRLHLVDAAFRVQGTGSLGVRRFVLLVTDGKHGPGMLVEAKEMPPSAVQRGGMVPPNKRDDGEAGRVLAGMRALLARPPIGTMALRGSDRRSYLMRLHAPGEDKLSLATVQDPEEFGAIARLFGERLGAAHRRASKAPLPKLDTESLLEVSTALAKEIMDTYQGLKLEGRAKRLLQYVKR